MSGLGLDQATEAKQDAMSGGRTNEAGIPEAHRVDYENETVAEGKGHAAAMVVFDYIARINIQTYGDDSELLSMEQNLEGAGRYGFDLELTLANPQLVEGQVWKQDGEYPEYKVIGDPASDDNSYELREEIKKDSDGSVVMEDGEPVVNTEGIGGLGSSSWDGQPIDGFDVDYFQVTISSRRASRILGALDTAGQWFRNRDGDVVEGVMETPPNFGTEVYDPDEDGYPRLVGYPELRQDMVGQKGAIAFTWGDANSSGNRAKEVDVFKVVTDEDGEEGLEALVPLTPEDGAYALPEYPRTNNTFWDDADAAGGEATEGDVGADTEPETDSELSDASEMMDSESGDSGNSNLPESETQQVRQSAVQTDSERTCSTSSQSRSSDKSDSDGGTETTYDDLNDDAQELVDDAAEVVSAKDLDSITALDGPDTSTDYDSFEDRVAMEDFQVNTTTDVLAEIIDSQANV